MANNLFNLVTPLWQSLSDLEYGYWLVSFGEALKKHDEHQGENGIPRPLAGGEQITESGNQVIALATAIKSGDHSKRFELEAMRPQTELQVSATINWVVTRSVVENKPSIRANLPLEEKKEKKYSRSSIPAILPAPINVKIARSDDHSGIAYVSVAKVPYASMYYVQISSGNPNDEASWIDGGQSDSCRRIEIKGLKPGEIYHFRVRCFGYGKYSAWSQFVTIRIL